MASRASHLCARESDVGPDNAYAALATEYDREEHHTTRILESLSGAGLRRAVAGPMHDREVGAVLEIGAGTGALTTLLLNVWPRARVLATDVSRDMLDILASKLAVNAGERLNVAVADVQNCVHLRAMRPAVIAAGLADPYLDAAGLEALRGVCDDGTRLFVSVPSRRWARRERINRLGIPIATTRFRACGGGILFAPSWTYDEDGLRDLLVMTGFRPLASGTERSDRLWSHPETSWAVAAARTP